MRLPCSGAGRRSCGQATPWAAMPISLPHEPSSRTLPRTSRATACDESPIALEILGAMGVGQVPQALPVLVENQLWLCGRDEPGTKPDFVLKLTGPPARIAERNKTLRRALVVADVEENLAARGHGHAPIDVDGARATIVGRMHDEADFRLDWTAGEDAHRTCDRHILLAKRLQQACQRALLDRQIDDDAECAVTVVLDHQDNGVGKARVAHAWRSDQQLTGKRGMFRRLPGNGLRGREKCREGENRRAKPNQAIRPNRWHASRPVKLRGDTNAWAP